MPEQTTSALEIARRLMAAMEGLSDRNPLMQTLEYEEPWGGTEEYERESGLTIGDLRTLCRAMEEEDSVPSAAPLDLDALAVTDDDIAYLREVIAARPEAVNEHGMGPSSLLDRVWKIAAALLDERAVLVAARRGVEDTARRPEQDYRKLTGCSHAIHEACANCSCGECGQRVVRAMAGGTVVTLPVAVAFHTLDAASAALPTEDAR